jgi:quercetin dioxygenase-like cupin family protein
MDQLEKALKHDVGGPLKRQAEARLRARMAEWGIPLSSQPVLVFDFGLGDFARFGLAENWIANDAEAGYCGKYLFIMEGQSCPRHRHKLKKETFFILRGRVRVWYDGSDRVLVPGDALTIERWIDHDFTGLEDSLILEVSQPTVVDDNYFTTEGVCYGHTLAKALEPLEAS